MGGDSALLERHRALLEAVAGSAAASSFMTHDVGALLSGDYLTTFGLDRCCEELAAVTTLAREAGVPLRRTRG